MYIHRFDGRCMMDEKCFDMLWIPNPNLHNVSNRSIQTSIFTTVLILQLVEFKRSQPCMNGMATLNDRVRKIMLIFSLMVVKPRGYNGDAFRMSFPSAPLSRTGRAGTCTWNCISSPSTETAAEAKPYTTADAAHAQKPERNPKQEPAPTVKCTGARQAAHRIAETASRTGRAGTCTWSCSSSFSAESAAETAAEGIAETTADAAHALRACAKPKAGTMHRNETISSWRRETLI